MALQKLKALHNNKPYSPFYRLSGLNEHGISIRLKDKQLDFS